jgi:hypothetical protein
MWLVNWWLINLIRLMILNDVITNFVDFHKMAVDIITKKMPVGQGMAYPSVYRNIGINLLNFFFINRMIMMLIRNQIVVFLDLHQIIII